jgi:hypothetical protein
MNHHLGQIAVGSRGTLTTYAMIEVSMMRKLLHNMLDFIADK